MGHKIFVSYKYSDSSVRSLNLFPWSTVRDYVDIFEQQVDSSDDIYKGESNDEDLSFLSDDAIWERLKDRIYDSSVTIVFLSPGMKENNKPEREQWIPWEVSYSLKETSRKTKSGMFVTSHSNAMLAVVLPDFYGLYDWYFEPCNCCQDNCIFHHSEKLFEIIRRNMFNRIKNIANNSCIKNMLIWKGDHSYIETVRWCDFIRCYQRYINRALERLNHIEDFNILKDVS